MNTSRIGSNALLHCGHLFHVACAVMSASASNQCPQCRAPLVSDALVGRPQMQRRVQQPTRVTSWPQIPAAHLEAQATQHVNRLTLWLRTRPNLYDSSAAGGASNLFVPLVHHALRRAGVSLPFFVIPDRQREHYAWNRVAQVTLRHQWGGAIVEAAWERLCAECGRLDEWRATLRLSVDAVQHYIQRHTMAVLEDRLSGRVEWPPVQDSGNSAIATTSSAVPGEDGRSLTQRIQESLLAGNPTVPDADVRQHAVYLAAQLVTHHCGPVAAVHAPPLSASQVAARQLVAEQDREYAQARAQDEGRAQRALQDEAQPVEGVDEVPDPVEPSAEEMRRVRLQRFGLATSGGVSAPSPRSNATLSNVEGDGSASPPQEL